MQTPWYLLVGCLLTACAPQERIVLLDALPGEQLTLSTAKGGAVLDTALQTARVETSGRVKVGQTTLPALTARYGPLLAAVPEEPRTFTFYFHSGKVQFDETGRALLATLLQEVQRRGQCEVEITGHTDQVGGLDANDRLSMARAEAVRALLWQGGLVTEFLRITGRGARAPLVNAPGRPEARNRRVEVLVR